MLFISFEYLLHRLAVERLEILQFQRLHHVEGAQLVTLEVGGLDVVLVGLLRGVDFEDAYLGAILMYFSLTRIAINYPRIYH